MVYFAFGITGKTVKEGICGAPMVDMDGRVAGFFSWMGEGGMFHFTPDLAFIIYEVWSLG